MVTKEIHQTVILTDEDEEYQSDSGKISRFLFGVKVTLVNYTIPISYESRPDYIIGSYLVLC